MLRPVPVQLLLHALLINCILSVIRSGRCCHLSRLSSNPPTSRASKGLKTPSTFRTTVPFWGQNYLEFEWLAPKTGLQYKLLGVRLAFISQ